VKQAENIMLAARIGKIILAVTLLAVAVIVIWSAKEVRSAQTAVDLSQPQDFDDARQIDVDLTLEQFDPVLNNVSGTEDRHSPHEQSNTVGNFGYYNSRARI